MLQVPGKLPRSTCELVGSARLGGLDVESDDAHLVGEELAQFDEGVHLGGGDVGLRPSVSYVHSFFILEPPRRDVGGGGGVWMKIVTRIRTS